MSNLRNPTKEEVREFLDLAEGNESGIYPDPYLLPTHGLGIRLDDKNDAFLIDYIEALGINPNQQVPHYIYQNGVWIENQNETKTLIEELKYLFTNKSLNPFHETQGIPSTSPVRMITNENQNIKAFDDIVYDAYLNSNTSYQIGGISSKFSNSVWEKLNSNERLALYSLNYNGGFNSSVREAIKLYTNQGASSTTGTLSTSQFIGKLHSWISILYFSNIRNDFGIENRRFIEANKFLGLNSTNTSSTISVTNFMEANIAISYMNQNYTLIKSRLNDFGRDYASNPNKYIRDNFSSAVSVFLSNQNYHGNYKIETLFTDWNLYTDLQIDLNSNGDPDGTTSYGDITGSDKKDLIFITGNQNGTTVHAGEGDDFVGGSSNNDVVYSGSGNDVINTYGGNDTVYTTDGTASDYNTVYLGAGSDTFYGGDGDDYVDGGSGALAPNVSSNIEATDSTTDENNINLGGGHNRYIGTQGKDIVSGTGYNTVYLGAGSDEYTGGDDVDIVDGGKLEDSITAENTINLGGGNDVYNGGIGKDIVYGGAGNDAIYINGGSNYVEGGTGHDIISLGDGNNEVHAGTGRDTVYLGVGNNQVYMGKDDQRDDVFLRNASGYTDHIYNCSSNDYVHLNSSVSSVRYVGKDMIMTLENGAKVHFHDFSVKEEEDQTDPEHKPAAGNAGAPFIVLPDNSVLGYGSNGQGYVDTGYKMPENGLGENGYKKDPTLPGEAEKPKLPFEEDDPYDNQPQPENNPDGPEDGLGGDGDRKIPQSAIDNPQDGPKTLGDLAGKMDGVLPFVLDIVDSFETARKQSSPLIVDLDGDGVKTVSRTDGVYFDHDGNGFYEKSGWVNSNDGLLVRDINGNGKIDNGSELFGNNTVLANGEKAANGFEALKDLDSNNDGVFNNQDTAWNEVKVWKDSNSNGIVDEGELLTLEQANIERYIIPFLSCSGLTRTSRLMI